ncbi:unnamed protein product [Gordionus sp. m RMFG-2023]|uniref:soluble guanylate cyclase 88E-like n=1 Tax=Gordionus sp. m RMFG-2023 TaxID=3053472 RepID=UPI0030E00460
MYGLVLEGIAEHLKQKFGEEVWTIIMTKVGIKHRSFSTHKIYSETLIPRLAKVAEEVTGVDHEVMMEEFGASFVTFLSQYGYDKILSVLGRRMRDFLSGLDNLHEYLRFTYPRLKAPSFSTSEESREGLTLTYKSKRKGYANYVKGQIKKVGRVFYKIDIEIQMMKELISKDSYGVVYRLYFDNSSFLLSEGEDPFHNYALNYERFMGTDSSSLYQNNGTSSNDLNLIPYDILKLDSSIYYTVFPFHVTFNKSMMIVSAGSALLAIMPDLIGQNIDETFAIIKPPFDFRWSKILDHLNNLFELITIVPIQKDEDDLAADNYDTLIDISEHSLHLKGQMVYLDQLQYLNFLGTPVMQELDDMAKFGLYINDLCMHDSSRDLLLAGTQQSTELKAAVDQEQLKSKKIALNMKRLDEEVKRTDQLLYQMIPKAVADRLRKGEPSVNTCEIFNAVSILFTDIANFNVICANISPMDVVTMLNTMYMTFDKIVSNHHVYKVETIADAYMIVSGAPIVAEFHAQYLAEATFDILAACSKLIDPFTKGNLQIRFGIHSGAVVAGVVGIKMPRYCLFGDTVNTASRMQSASEPLKIHISETTKKQLEGFPYHVEKRGVIDIKGKGTMETYWLLNKTLANYSPALEAKRREYEAIISKIDRRGSMLSMESNINLISKKNHPEVEIVDDYDYLGGDEVKESGFTYNPVTIMDIAKSQSSLHSKVSTVLPSLNPPVPDDQRTSSMLLNLPPRISSDDFTGNHFLPIDAMSSQQGKYIIMKRENRPRKSKSTISAAPNASDNVDHKPDDVNIMNKMNDRCHFIKNDLSKQTNNAKTSDLSFRPIKRSNIFNGTSGYDLPVNTNDIFENKNDNVSKEIKSDHLKNHIKTFNYKKSSEKLALIKKSDNNNESNNINNNKPINNQELSGKQIQNSIPKNKAILVKSKMCKIL